MDDEIKCRDRFLVRYAGEELFHERLVGCVLASGEVMTCSPDGDTEVLRLSTGDHLDYVAKLPPDRALPQGVDEDQVYLFWDGRTPDMDITDNRVGQLIQRCKDAAVEQGLALRSVSAPGVARRVRQKSSPVVEAPRDAGIDGTPAEGVQGQALALHMRRVLPVAEREEHERPADWGPRPMTQKPPATTIPKDEPVKDDDEVWVVADPSHGLPLGAETSAPTCVLGTQGLILLDGRAVHVEKIRLESLTSYPKDRASDLQKGLSLAQPAVDGNVTPRGSEEGGAEHLRAAALLVARAQRSARSSADNQAWLFSQLKQLPSRRVATVLAENYSDAGVLRVSLGRLYDIIAGLGGPREEGSPMPRLDASGEDADARVLPIMRNQLGVRQRSFADAVADMRESEWGDWPVHGPRTVMFVLNFIATHFNTPDARHGRFLTDGRLNSTDIGIMEHQALLKMLNYGACYDQLDLPQCAWAELACRRVQLIELKHKDKFMRGVASSAGGGGGGGKKGNQLRPDVFDDAHLYMGMSATRGMLCVSPALEAWVGKELTAEFTSLKERRKALEERKALKGPDDA